MTERIAPPRSIVIAGNEIVAFPARDQVRPELQAFHDYWTGPCGGAVPVPRAAMDPVRMPPRLLPHILVVEYLAAEDDFLYRLIGTEITTMVGRDSTGKRFSEVAYQGAFGDRLRCYFATVTGSSLALYGEDRADWIAKEHLVIASLLLPAASDGQRTDLVFGAIVAAR